MLALVAAAACKSGSKPPAPVVEVVKDAGAAETGGGARGTMPKGVELGAVVDVDHRGQMAEVEEHVHVACPVKDPLDPDQLLDMGADRYDAGEYEVALACAETAADLIPNAIEAHHLRAAALSAQGRFGDAQTAFSMALALDPDDPETLAAAADFYINAVIPKRRDTTMVGLEYARRGSDKASLRLRRDYGLRARLALLEGQALNDLGRADEALPRVALAREFAPDMIAATYEQGVSLFNLCRFDDAYGAFTKVLRAEPDDPYAHYYLGLLYERSGRETDSAAHFARARELAPGEFPAPVIVPSGEFRALVDAAIAQLPPQTRTLLGNVTIETPDLPALEDLVSVDPPFAPTILGLYRGLPVGSEPRRGEPPPPPRAIVLYRLNLGRAVRTRDELVQQIVRTLEHEIGHLEGLDEDELRRRGLE